MRRDFEQVPLVGTGTSTAADVAVWLASPPVHALVAAFAASEADRALAQDLRGEHGSLTRRLARLDAFSDRWDTRQGQERSEAPDLALTRQQGRLVLAAAEALGMRGGSTGGRFRRYDHVLILGGSIWGCLVRIAHAARLVFSGEVQAGSVTALGGHRPFSGNEFDVAATVGLPELTEEYAALDHLTRKAFDLGEPEAVAGEVSALSAGTWGVRHYRTATGLDVRVCAAPSGDPARRRANTADTYDFFARQPPAPRPGDRLLIVTTPINVPAQHAAALRTLAQPLGVVVDTVGTGPESAPAGLAHQYTATQYLLEVRSTVRALRRLIDSA